MQAGVSQKKMWSGKSVYQISNIEYSITEIGGESVISPMDVHGDY